MNAPLSVKIIKWYYLALGVLGILLSILVGILAGALTGFVSIGMPSMAMAGGALIIGAIIAIAWSIFNIYAATQLTKPKQWARIYFSVLASLAIISALLHIKSLLSILDLLIHAAIIYFLWFHKPSKEFFEGTQDANWDDF